MARHGTLGHPSSSAVALLASAHQVKIRGGGKNSSEN